MTFRKISDYPKTILVGDSVYKVSWHRTLGQTATHITWGLCDPGDKTIQLRLGGKSKERLKTFVHEVLHAIEFEYEIEIPHKLIRDLEAPIARLIIDNVFSSGKIAWYPDD
jgi:hypothetical protein